MTRRALLCAWRAKEGLKGGPRARRRPAPATRPCAGRGWTEDNVPPEDNVEIRAQVQRSHVDRGPGLGDHLAWSRGLLAPGEPKG